MQIKVGESYINRQGDIVKITKIVVSVETGYRYGFRWRDDLNRTYKDDGSFNLLEDESPFDLERVIGDKSP